MKVAIRLGNDVKLDAMGLKTDVSGGLNIRQDPEKPLAGNGRLVLTNGRFKAYGQNLIIKEGRILFSGPLDRPFLNIEANRDPDTIEGQVTVGVRVTGPASKPEITVYLSRRWRSRNSSPIRCAAKGCRPVVRMAVSTACWWPVR